MIKRAFTLVELIITVAVIAVVTVAGLISFSVLIGSRLESDTRKIVADLCWARQMAVARHQNCIVDFDVGNDRYIMYRGTSVVKIEDLEVDLVSLTDFYGSLISPAQITFNFPKGTAQGRIINLSHRGKTKQIMVFAETGYVKIQ